MAEGMDLQTLHQEVTQSLLAHQHEEELAKEREAIVKVWRPPSKKGGERIFVANLLWNVTERELERFLVSGGWGGPVAECRIHKDANQASLGRASVDLVPSANLTRLLDKHRSGNFGSAIAARNIGLADKIFVRRDDPEKSRSAKGPGFTMVASGMDFGDMIPADDRSMTLMVLWEFTDRVELSISPHDKELHMIFLAPTENGNGPCVEFKMTVQVCNVEGGMLYSLSEASGHVRLTVCLRCPPRIYIKRPRPSDPHTNPGDAGWAAGGSRGGSGPSYQRTPDLLTPDQAIGRSTAIQFKFAATFEAWQGKGALWALDQLHLLDPRCLQGPAPLRSIPPGQWEGFDPTQDVLEDALEPRVLYMLEVLISRGMISRYVITQELLQDLEETDPEVAEEALELLRVKGPVLFSMGPACLLETYRKIKFFLLRDREARGGKSVHPNYLKVPRLQVTPTRFVRLVPEVEMSNRVLRANRDHTDRFLRVSFSDEDGQRLRNQDLQPEMSARIRTALDGVTVAGRPFEFLAYGSSQLREHGCWFFAPLRAGGTCTINAGKLRAQMGDFSSVRTVAKRAARLGQSLSCTVHGCEISSMERRHIKDVELIRANGEKYCFSDGVGQMSQDVRDEVFERLVQQELFGLTSESRRPSAYQFRYAGCKGMATLHPPLHGRVLALRKSQIKFQSQDEGFGVVAIAKWMPAFLSRQIIAIFSTRRVANKWFMAQQEAMMKELRDIHTDRGAALKVLSELGEPTEPAMAAALKTMINAGFSMEEPWLRACINAIHEHQLMLLRKKSRVLVRNGCVLFGVMDEFNVLKYGEVFVQMSDGRNNEADGKVHPITGNVVVVRAPPLHPGDALVLKAVRKKQLEHLVDVIVFPQQGPRPHPNETSGGDLDGDTFWITWDKAIAEPLKENYKYPMDFTPPSHLRPTVFPQGESVSLEHLKDFFVQYIKHDNIGMIATAWQVWADKCPGEKNSNFLQTDVPQCLKLAELHSVAVDFAKTGIPAVMMEELRIKERPDFQEANGPSYVSTQIIGLMYRAVLREIKHVERVQQEEQTGTQAVYDPLLEMDGCERYLAEAFNARTEYEFELLSLMDTYKVYSEAELLTGCVRQFHAVVARGQKTVEIRKRLDTAMRTLRAKYRQRFEETADKQNATLSKMQLASAWYKVTYGNNQNPPPDPQQAGQEQHKLWSFPWIVYDWLMAVRETARVRANRQRGPS